MNITQALKLKARIKGNLNRLWKTVQTRNTISVFESTKNTPEEVSQRNAEFDELIADYFRQFGQLIKLKTAIKLASGPIVHKLVELNELRSRVLQWEALNVSSTEHKVETTKGNAEPVNFRLHHYFGYKQVQTELTRLRKVIEQLEDEIDVFNANMLVTTDQNTAKAETE